MNDSNALAVTDTELAGAKSAVKGPPKKSDEDLISIACKRLTVGIDAVSDSRDDELEDLKFAAGSSDNNWQWDEYAQGTRTSPEGKVAARPMLTINQIPQHIKQVTNDQQQNRPTGKVIAVNGEANIAVAEIFNGIVRHIEYISDADVSYDTACESQVTIGEGYWRILTDYADEDSFDQEIFIRRIRNSFSVYLDPMMQDPCGADAKWGFITETMTKEEFEEQYPDATPISAMIDMGPGDQDRGVWISKDTIRVAEYFYVETWYEKLFLFGDNRTAFEGTAKYGVLLKEYGDPVKSRKSKRERVKWFKFNGYEILERGDWAGKYIPIVKVVGNEFEIEGEIYTSGIVRNAKDPQRMYNYHASLEVEMIALAPKAPYIGYTGQFNGHEKKWNSANTTAWPYLEVNNDVFDGNGNPLPLPQRAQPPMVQSGIIAAKQAAAEDIKKATGQYNASLGQQGNERSGKAIMARQHEGDVSTYHYGANLARAVRYSTRQLVDLIPKIYDTERVARIIGEDGKESMVAIDPNQAHPVTEVRDSQDPRIIIKKIYNLNVGKYDVAVTTGPGYATKRQEALDAMVQLLQGNPALWSLAGDLIVKNMDWPGAQELSKRLGKAIDPKLTADEDASPALQHAMMQIQQLTEQYQHATSMLGNVEKSIEMQELKIKKDEVRIKSFQAETERLKVTQAAMNPNEIDDLAQPEVEPAPQAPPLDQNKLMMENSKHVLQANQHAHEREQMAQQQSHDKGMLAAQPEPSAPEGE